MKTETVLLIGGTNDGRRLRVKPAEILEVSRPARGISDFETFDKTPELYERTTFATRPDLIVYKLYGMPDRAVIARLVECYKPSKEKD